VELGLFRIAQEAVSNARKHSNASRVSVTVGFLADAVSVVISDDGRGFELPENLCDLAPMGKLGLVGMQERAQLLDGEFAVQSAPGKGTVVRVSVKAGVPAGSPAAT